MWRLADRQTRRVPRPWSLRLPERVREPVHAARDRRLARRSRSGPRDVPRGAARRAPADAQRGSDRRAMAHKPLEFLYERFTALHRGPPARAAGRRDDRVWRTATFPDGSLPDVNDVMLIAEQLVRGGRETTARLLSTMLRYVAERPELQQLLRDKRELIPAFVEEAVRLESPIQGDFRLSRVPTTVGGVDLPAGTTVMLLNGAANRDPREFEDPTELRLDRPNGRYHLGFGFGIHLCAGAPLARAEARVSLERILDRTRRHQVCRGGARRRPATAGTSTRRCTCCAASNISTWNSRRSPRDDGAGALDPRGVEDERRVPRRAARVAGRASAAARRHPDDAGGGRARSRVASRRCTPAVGSRIHWPVEHGGRNATPAQVAIYNYELARAGAPPLLGRGGISLVGPTLVAHGTDEQRRRWIPRIVAGDDVWCQLFSEPDAGQRPGQPHDARREARRRLRRARAEGVVVVRAVRQLGDRAGADRRPSARRSPGISMLAIPMTADGVEIRPLRQITGASEFNEVFLDGVVVPVENRIGPENEGWRVTSTTLANERGASFIWKEQVLHELAIEQLLATCADRRQLGDPVVRQRLVRSWIDIELFRLHNARTLERLARGEEVGPESSVVKLFWAEHEPALRTTRRSTCSGPTRCSCPTTATRSTTGAGCSASSRRGPHRSWAARARSSATSSASACSDSRGGSRDERRRRRSRPHRSRPLRARRVSARHLDATARRVPRRVLRAGRLRTVLGDHEARRHRRDRQAAVALLQREGHHAAAAPASCCRRRRWW